MLWILIKKEFLDIARDRRTLIMSLGLPLLLFPLMMVVADKISSSTRKTAKAKISKVALVSHGSAEEFRRMLLGKGPLLTQKGTISVREDVTLEDGRRLIEADSLDVLVYFDPDFERMLDSGIPGRISVYFKRTTDGGREERRRVVDLLDAYESRLYDRRMAELKIDPRTALHPVEINEFNLASDKEVFAGAVGRILPYMFIMFSIMGVMHPATDLAAGEKERGTLETLLTTPATRLQILFAKFLVVVTSGFVSGIVTMGSMYIGTQFLGKGSSEINKAIASLLEPTTVVGVIALLLPLTVFFAAIALAISVYAKSFKEAQTLLAPMIMVAMLPILVSVLPGIELTAKTALIPILNVSLSIRAIIAGTAQPFHLVLVYGSLSVLALAGLFLCSKMFERESAVFRN
jgi:sodium transport system permease protein